MRGDFFDSNILIYAADGGSKGRIAVDLIASRGSISVQVLNEFVNVARRKMLLDWPPILYFLTGVRAVLEVHPVDLVTHDYALVISEEHHVPIYDAAIIAAALRAGCRRLLSEDMQDGRMFEGRLRIVNPFV